MHRNQKVRLRLTVGPVSERDLDTDEGEIFMLVLTDLQKVTLSVSFVDAAGNPATVDGAPTWSSSDSSITVVTPSADGLTAVASTVGPLGTSEVSVTADADLGTGVTPVTGTLDVQVVASQATAATIGTGTPE